MQESGLNDGSDLRDDYNSQLNHSCTFNTFDDMIKYNIDWINDKFANNQISRINCYANNQHERIPTKCNKELMMRLNDLGFLTTYSQGGYIESTNEYVTKVRTYIDGYILTDTAEKLQNIMNYDGKYFQYIPIKQSIDCEINSGTDCVLHYEPIAIAMQMNRKTGEINHTARTRVDPREFILQSAKCVSNDELYNDYSYCYSWDPLFGIPFDDKDNGLIIKLCECMEKSYDLIIQI
jgi:hypothetical protein